MAIYFKGFKISHWILFIAGVLSFGKITYEFLFNKLDFTTINAVAFILSIVCFSAPKFIIKLFQDALHRRI